MPWIAAKDNNGIMHSINLDHVREFSPVASGGVSLKNKTLFWYGKPGEECYIALKIAYVDVVAKVKAAQAKGGCR